MRPGQRRCLINVLENGESKDNRDFADKIESGDLSIEHIMPQTRTPAWREELSPEAEAVHDL